MRGGHQSSALVSMGLKEDLDLKQRQCEELEGRLQELQSQHDQLVRKHDQLVRKDGESEAHMSELEEKLLDEAMTR